MTPKICCTCHHILDSDGNATGRKATDAEEKRGSHGHCNKHLDEWYENNPGVVRRG